MGDRIDDVRITYGRFRVSNLINRLSIQHGQSMDTEGNEQALALIQSWFCKFPRVDPDPIAMSVFADVAVEYTSENKASIVMASAAVIGTWLVSHTTPIFTRNNSTLSRIGTKSPGGIAPYSITSVSCHFKLPVEELTWHILRMINEPVKQ